MKYKCYEFKFGRNYDFFVMKSLYYRFFCWVLDILWKIFCVWFIKLIFFRMIFYYYICIWFIFINYDIFSCYYEIIVKMNLLYFLM